MRDSSPTAPTTQDILALINAGTVDEQARRIATQPALLTDNNVDAVLQRLLAHYANDPHTTRKVEQTRALLQRCREIGIVATQAELANLQHRDAIPFPPHFLESFAQAWAAQQRYQQDLHDVAALDAALTHWDAIMFDPSFAHTPGAFRLAVLHDASLALSRRFTVRGNLDDLTWAIVLLQAVVEATSENDPRWPQYRNTLGTLLYQRYQRIGALSDLDAAITYAQAALAAAQAHPTERNTLAGYRINLSTYLSDRYTHTDNAADLDRALELAQDAVAATPVYNPHRHSYRSNLAARLHQRSIRTNSLDDLNEAIELAQAVVQATSATSPDWPERCTNLGIYLSDRSQRTGNTDDRTAAICHYQDALKACGSTLPDIRCRAATNLGRLFYVQERYAEARNAFEQALDAAQQLAGSSQPHAALIHLVFCDIYLDPPLPTATAPPSSTTLEAILALIEASTWVAWQRIITTHQDDLLTNQADTVLARIGQRARQAQHLHLEDRAEQRRRLLQRCREIGIDAACAEVAGLQQPIALAIPTQFASAVERVQTLRQRYQYHTHDVATLDEELDAWNTIMFDPSFAHTPGAFRLAVWHDASLTLSRRFTVRGNLDDLTRAIELAQKVVEATPKDDPRWPQYHNTLGTLLYQRHQRIGALSDLDAAITYAEEALAAAQAHPTERNTLAGYRINLSTYLSDRYTHTGNTDNAADLDRALELARDAVAATPEDDADGRLYRSNLAARLHQRSIRTKSLADLNEAIELAQATESLADLNEAIELAQAVVQATPATSPDWPERCTNLGIYLSDRSQRTGNTDDRTAAIRHYQNALEACGSTLPDIRRRAATNLGRLFYVQGRYAEARNAFEQAHAAIQQLTSFTQPHAARRQLSQENAQLYAHLVCCCLHLGDPEAAFTYAAAGKGRALVDMLAADRFDLTTVGVDQPELQADIARVRELRTWIDAILARLPTSDDAGHGAALLSTAAPTLELHDLARLEAAYQQQLQTIASRYPQLTATAHVPDLQPHAARDLAAQLGATLVEFFKHAQGWCAFVITAANVQHVPLPDLTDEVLHRVEKWIAGFSLPWKFCYERNPQQELTGLHTAIFAPLAAHLPHGGRVVLAPAGRLHQVPLGAALHPDTGRYASDTYLLSIAPSVGALAVAHASRQQRACLPPNPSAAPGRALVVMHPGDDHREDFRAVLQPAADQIATCFAHSHTLYEQDARPAQVIRAASDGVVLHFFCHGTHNPNNALMSGLYLEQGLLSVQQVLTELHLHQTRLVSLGACVSACLEIVEGEEHIGLPWALLTARAQAVVGSLWPVQAGATVFLFTVFYQQVAAGQSPAAALQAAMRAVRDQPAWHSPYYWAAFQVIGLALEGDIPLAASTTAPCPLPLPDMQQLLSGGSMDLETFVETTAEIVRIMAEDDRDLVRAALQDDPSARAALAQLVSRAAQVQDDDDAALLALAEAIVGFIQQCPPLAERYIMPGTHLWRGTATASIKNTTGLAQRYAPGIRNHLYKLLSLVEPTPKDAEPSPPTPPVDTTDEGQSPS